MINCIAIDDEPLALEVIEAHCNKINFINLKKTFLSSVEAIEYIPTSEIDVIFLDINMPEINGLIFKSFIPDHIQIIFITAYHEHAVKSYDIGATDYILKPVSFDRFYKSVQKCHERKQQQALLAPQNTNEVEPTILVKSDKKVMQILIREILYVEGLKDYVKIFFGDNEKVVIRESLRKILERLGPHGFIHTHRSYIVPVDKITALSGNVIFVDQKEIPLSKSHRGELIAMFKEKGILGDRSV